MIVNYLAMLVCIQPCLMLSLKLLRLEFNWQLSCTQAIASPGKQGRLEPALDCLHILPSERGRYYFELIKHYCSKGNCYALGRLQKALFADHRWKTFQQYPGAAW